ncbi:MAG TPA: MFS transporter, partial [Thermoanaerobaculia bacterium]
LVYGLIEGPSVGWEHVQTWGSISAGVVGLAALSFVELRAAHPMVPLRLFRNRTFAAANLLTFFLYGALAATFYFIPFVLIQARGYTPTRAGASILPLVIIIASLSRSTGALADRIGPRLPLTVGPLVSAGGFLLLGFLPSGGSYVATVLPGLCVLGLGMAIAVAPLTATVLNGVPSKDQGAASGISNAVARVAGLLAVAAFGVVAGASFNRTFDRALAGASVSTATRQRIAPERTKLGAMKPPANAPTSEAEAIKAAVKRSLNGAFRVVSAGCAGLAVLSAASAAIGVSGKRAGRSSKAGG